MASFYRIIRLSSVLKEQDTPHLEQARATIAEARKSPANFSYRALELLCRQQAKFASTPVTRDELERMALE